MSYNQVPVLLQLESFPWCVSQKVYEVFRKQITYLDKFREGEE